MPVREPVKWRFGRVRSLRSSLAPPAARRGSQVAASRADGQETSQRSAPARARDAGSPLVSSTRSQSSPASSIRPDRRARRQPDVQLGAETRAGSDWQQSRTASPLQSRDAGSALKADPGATGARSAKQIRKIIASNPALLLPTDKRKRSVLWGVERPLTFVAGSAYLLEAICEVSSVHARTAWLPAVVGGGIGLGFTLLNRFGMRRVWQEPRQPLNVVVTGSTRGIGKAIARVFLEKGDRVMITSRSPNNVREALKQLRDEVGKEHVALHGIDCNVSSPGAVQRLADAAKSQMGSVDVWINNAGCSGTFQDFLSCTPEHMQAVVQTNLTGTLLGTKAALRCMRQQPQGGHIFNIDGAGADGGATPYYTAYGATKAGIAHLMGSLLEEQKLQKPGSESKSAARSPVGIHTLSPGMVLTPLLLDGATDRNKAIFNVLCEQPETVAAFLVPRVRTVVARGRGGEYIRFLTLAAALRRFLTAPLAANRFFSKTGEALYLDERQRILNPLRSKATRRLAARAARQDKDLALAYSLSLAASFLILVADAQGGSLGRLPFLG